MVDCRAPGILLSLYHFLCVSYVIAAIETLLTRLPNILAYKSFY